MIVDQIVGLALADLVQYNSRQNHTTSNQNPSISGITAIFRNINVDVFIISNYCDLSGLIGVGCADSVATGDGLGDAVGDGGKKCRCTNPTPTQSAPNSRTKSQLVNG